jgi:fibronectin-binding autotransporter adhesin
MKQIKQTVRRDTSMKPTSQRLKSFFTPIRHLLALALFLCAAGAIHAQTVIWDANGGTNGGSDGSGIWEGSTNWFYSGAAQGWPGGATGSAGPTAVIGAGVPGNYLITLTQPESALFFTNNTSGYTLGGSQLTLTSSAASASPGEFSLGTGVMLTVTNQIGLSGGYIVLGSGATLNYGGPKINAGGNARIYGQDLTSVVNLTNGFGEGGTLDLSSCTVNLYGGTLDSTGRVDLGRGVGYGNGQTTVNVYGGLFYASGSVAANNGHFQICRSSAGAQCTLNVYAGTIASQNTFEISPDTQDVGTLTMGGGYLNVGSGGSAGTSGTPGSSQSTLLPLTMLTAASTGTQSAIMNVTGGVITASELLLGGSGTYSSNSTLQINVSGGYIYLDAGGIQLAGGVTGLNYVTSFSGGTLAATANWTASIPLTLSSNLTTLQPCDTNLNPMTITLSGGISGAGGVVINGPGTVIMSGADTYTGSTTISNNGELAIIAGTTGGSSIGGVSNLSSTLSTQPASIGASWNCTSLSFSPNTTADFNYGTFLPSASHAAIAVSGKLTLASTCTVSIEAANIYVGTYPLIAYGSFSGSLPGTLVLPSGVTAHLLNSGTAIELVVTSSPNTAPAVRWNTGNGVWDTSTTNWQSLVTGNPSTYANGDVVDFLDIGAANPVTLTLNSTVTPLSITSVNVTNTFLITGSGAISGSTPVTVQGNGTLALGTTNTYTGGTTVTAGALAINYGGDGLHNSAIGTGPLTLTNGGSLDNTSTNNVTLVTPIAITLGNFGFVGTTNLTLGSTNNTNGGGTVTMGQNVVATINSNRLTVNSPITDNGSGYSMTKRGNGALALNGTNTYTGGTILDTGELDFNFGGDGNGDSAVGSGLLTLNGGTLDNTSGSWVTNIQNNTMFWSGACTFKGTTNLDLGAGAINVSPGAGFAMTITSNCLFTEGTLSGANGPGITKSGLGTWVDGGSIGACIVTINAGTVALNDNSGGALGSGGAVTINTGGLLIISNAIPQIAGEGVTLSGGTFDINGNSAENPALTFNSGTIKDSGGLSTQVPDELTSSGTIPLGNANCVISVPSVTNALDIPTAFRGTGSLITAGAGTVSLGANETYTGNTTVGPGTLALYDGTGSAYITTSSNIILSTSTSILDLTGNTDTNGAAETLTLYSGQGLQGFGTVKGLIISTNGSTVSPGSASAVGTLTGSATGASRLSGTTVMKIDGPLTNDQLSVSGSLVEGGTLVITNLSGATAAVGDTFTLFKAAGGISGVFTNIVFDTSRPDWPGFGLAWNTNNLAIQGTLSVVAATVPPSPIITGVGLAGTTLTIHGTNGVPNETFVLMTTTNLALTVPNWTPVSTNAFSGSGNFSVTVTETNVEGRFFTLWMK